MRRARTFIRFNIRFSQKSGAKRAFSVLAIVLPRVPELSRTCPREAA